MPRSGRLRASECAAIPRPAQDSCRGLPGNMARSNVTAAAAMTAPYAEVKKAPRTAQPETPDLRTCTRLRIRNGTNTNGNRLFARCVKLGRTSALASGRSALVLCSTPSCPTRRTMPDAVRSCPRLRNRPLTSHAHAAGRAIVPKAEDQASPSLPNWTS